MVAFSLRTTFHVARAYGVRSIWTHTHLNWLSNYSLLCPSSLDSARPPRSPLSRYSWRMWGARDPTNQLHLSPVSMRVSRIAPQSTATTGRNSTTVSHSATLNTDSLHPSITLDSSGIASISGGVQRAAQNASIFTTSFSTACLLDIVVSA